MSQTELLDLNDECLEHIFNRMDLHSILTTSKACKRFNRIAENVYKMQREFWCEMDLYNDEQTKDTSVIIRKIGKHLAKFMLILKQTDKEEPNKIYNDDCSEFLKSIQYSFSNKLRELWIGGRLLTTPTLMLSTTFKSLTKLVLHKYIQDIREWKASLDLRTLCPNLQTLIITNCPWILAKTPIKKFKNLIELEFQALGSYYPPEWFECFFKENKQLRQLSIGQLMGRYEYTEATMYEDYDLFDFEKVVRHLTDLEQFEIDIEPFTNVPQGLIALSRLNNLHTLKVGRRNRSLSTAKLNEILRILKKFTQLKHLHVNELSWKRNEVPERQSIVNIAIELKSLRTFYSDLHWEWETVYEFIRRARSLMEIEVYLTENATPNAIRKIAAARKSALVYEHQPLKINLKYLRGSETEDVDKVFEEPDVRRFLQKMYRKRFYMIPQLK